MIIRVYVISGFNFSSRDNGSFSDPFLRIECNKQIIDERDNYQLDEPNPDFYKCYDFKGKFPGTTPLKVEAFDYDLLFGDELIGCTYIDLEDRFFSLEWQNLEQKPIEYRELFHPMSKIL